MASEIWCSGCDDYEDYSLLACLMFYLEDGCSSFLWNSGVCPPKYTASHSSAVYSTLNADCAFTFFLHCVPDLPVGSRGCCFVAWMQSWYWPSARLGGRPVLYRYSRCGRRLFSGVSNNFQRTVSSFNHMRWLMALNCLKESRLYVFRSIVCRNYLQPGSHNLKLARWRIGTKRR